MRCRCGGPFAKSARSSPLNKPRTALTDRKSILPKQKSLSEQSFCFDLVELRKRVVRV